MLQEAIGGFWSELSYLENECDDNDLVLKIFP